MTGTFFPQIQTTQPELVMDDLGLIGELQTALRTFVYRHGQMQEGDVVVSFETPTSTWLAGCHRPTVNFDLQRIHPHRDSTLFRQEIVQRQELEGGVWQRTAPLGLELQYQICCHHTDTQVRDRLLWQMVFLFWQHDQHLPDDVYDPSVLSSWGPLRPLLSAMTRPGVQGAAQDPQGGAAQSLGLKTFPLSLTAPVALYPGVLTPLVFGRELRSRPLPETSPPFQGSPDAPEPSGLRPILLAGHSGATPATDLLAPPQTVRYGLSISGHVLNVAGQGQPAVTVTFTHEEDGRCRGQAVTDQNGRFQLRGVRPGRLNCRVQAAGANDQFKTLTVPSRQGYTLTLDHPGN